MGTDPHASRSSGDRLSPDVAGRILSALERSDDPGHHRADLPRIPGYVLDAELGRGASGVVYRAVHDGGGHAVALKVLSVPLGAGSQAQRALREIDILTGLRLPCVPRMLDQFEHHGRLCIVTELVDGEPLDAYCESRRLSIRERVALLAEVADAVHALHEQGVIHRDLKPSNVLIDERGRPVLIDLGLASLVATDVMQTLTADGTPLGTPAFMAPEQARADRAAVSTRSDVYALGAIGFLLVTGRTPHNLVGVTLHEAIRRVAQEPARDAREVTDGVDKSLAAVLGKALSAEPSGRYASAAEFAADLRRWLKGKPVEARPAGIRRRFAGSIGRHPIVATAISCLTIAVVSLCMTMISVWWFNRAPNEIVVSEDGTEARLLARSGAELERWTGERFFASRLVKRPAEFGGGQVVLLARVPTDSEPAAETQLIVFDAADLSKPLWTTPNGAPDLAAPTSEWSSANPYYTVSQTLVADLFPEHPGDEVVVVHSESGSHPHCIRVYGLEGDVLYEAWHVGSIDSMFWHPGMKQIVAVGMSGLVDLQSLGVQEPEAARAWPIILFAVAPSKGKNVGWLHDDAGGRGPGWAWSLALTPWPLNHSFRAERFRLPKEPTDRLRAVDVIYKWKSGDAAVVFRLDARGRLMREPEGNDALVRMERAEGVLGLRLADFLPNG